MSGNRGVVYLGAGKVEVQKIDYPKMQDPRGKKIEHGVILRVVSTNICGSDQHMVRGRTTAQVGLVLGHEITGEVIEKGTGVENLQIGDLVSVPFNVACGLCRSCKEQHTGVCLTVNPGRPGGAYGYVDMGDWTGELKRRLESIRLQAGPKMNLGDVTNRTVPKMSLISAPASGGAINSRTFIPHTCHASIGVFGAVSVATACLIRGSVAQLLARVPSTEMLELSVEHPTGEFTVEIQRSDESIVGCGLLRTARLLFDGKVCIQTSSIP